MRLAPLLLLTASFSAFSQTYTASTFAGSVPPENLPAASISVGQVAAIAADPAGNIFVALLSSSAVFRVDATTGLFTRVAGNGTSGFSGDGGPALSAQLNGPNVLAVDLAGNLYIGDSGNHRVRKVANGVITTVAGNGAVSSSGDGGPATSAGLEYLPGLATDLAGNLYIADGSGVRKVSNGTITTVAGTQGYYGSLAIDAAGNLYLADYGNARVVKVAGGVSTTVAGNGTSGFSGDNGPATSAQLGEDQDDCGIGGMAVDPAGSIYIADACNDRIRKVSNGIITTVAGGGASSGYGILATTIRLAAPNLVTVDSAGNLYVAQEWDEAAPVFKVAGNGIAAIVAGNGAQSFSGDNGPAINAQFNRPSGVVIDSLGRMYVADTRNNRVRMIVNGVVTTVVGDGTPGFGGDNGLAVNAQLSFPIGLALSPAGDLYIADNNRVRKVSNGIIATVAGTLGYSPISIAADSAGSVYLYIAPNQVLKVSNGTVTPVAGNGKFGSAGDHGPALSAALTGVNEMAVDANGNLYLADSGRIRRVSGGVITTMTGGNGVALDSAGNLFIADGNLGLIRKSANGAFTSFPATPATQLAQLGGYTALAGYGIAVDPSGNVYGSDGTRIVVLKPDGSVSPATSSSVDFIHNSASNQFSGIASGEIVTFSGTGLGPTQLVSALPGDNGVYATQLAGTTVQFNGVSAPLLYTSATQVSAVAPYGVSGANTQVTVTYKSQTSVPASVAVFPSAPGLFTLDGSGIGQAAAVNQDGSLNSASNPAPIGSVISFYCTGGGQTFPGGVDGKVATLPLPQQTMPLLVQISGSLVGTPYLQYAGAAPGEIAGVMQINFQIPPGITPGSALSFGIVVGNTSPSQQGVTIAVSPSVN